MGVLLILIGSALSGWLLSELSPKLVLVLLPIALSLLPEAELHAAREAIAEACPVEDLRDCPDHLVEQVASPLWEVSDALDEALRAR